MQYGADVKNYVRDKQLKKEKVHAIGKNENYLRLIAIAFAGIFISRVYFEINLSFIQSLAPFGLLYVMTISSNNIKEGVIALLTVVAGYVSLTSKIGETPVFVISSILILGANALIKKKSTGVKDIVGLFITFIVIVLNGVVVLKKDLVGSLVIAFAIVAILFPLYYIVAYGIKCVGDFKLENYINTDEIISVEILISIIIAGIGSIGLFGLEFRNIVGIFFIFFMSYICRGNLGSTAGIITGFILGIITGNLYFYLATFGVSALIVSMFRETGKVVSFVAFNAIFIFMAVYTKQFDNLLLVEVLVGSGIVMFTPKEFIDRIRVELDSETRKEEDSEKHFNKIKNELTVRLGDFTEVLMAMGNTLEHMVENEKLVSQNKGDELVDNLAERVCKNCDYRNTCWRREINETYSSFKEMIQGFEEGDYKFPEHLRKKCLKEAKLVKAAEEVVSKHIADEMLKKRLGEGRKMIASHVKSMSDTIGEIASDFKSEVNLDVDTERGVRKALLRENVKFDYLIAYTDKEGRLNIKIEMMNCGGGEYCTKSILPVINKTIGKKMSISTECKISATTGMCEIHILEAPKYYVDSAIALSAKTGEKYTGDSYSFGKSKDGNHIVMLCDGMGTGPRAGAESKIAVEMVEKFSEVGFNEKIAINTVNTIMNIKFSEEEKFSTLDMQKINLYDGNAKFLKVGAMESFIKRGHKVKLVDSKTLPFGVLDNPDIDEQDYKLKAGDFIITISDGILDLAKDGDLNNEWLINLIQKSVDRTSKDLANRILDVAKEFNNGKARDDMTVIVSKLYNIQ
ncbi:stage II sporulation protein E [uncultured Clostridium sp.]|jgi:stage II sporulation protein E|uniref:stage II sporulation protein E n=1 Tax=uncultured Clostridium sp. TaxID=59620 RepID=UPI00263A1724|nr:stage II sporulation protein E [uncultured Clostridium sp.]